MNETWTVIHDRWRRFEAWEREWLRRLPPGDPRYVAWAAEARELALRLDPSAASFAAAEPHWRRMAVLHRRLVERARTP